MIPINNKDLDSIALEHFEAIETHLNNRKTKFSYLDIEEWISSNLIKAELDENDNSQSYTFREIVLANPRTLTEIINSYRGSTFYNNSENTGPEFPDEILYIRKNLYGINFANSSKYLVGTEYNASSLIEKLNVNLCPYCNRNYINNLRHSSGMLKRTSHVDHFHNKKDYPFLAMSFYNLIPSCYSCNHVKSDDDITYTPYNTNYKANDLLKFQTILRSSDLVSDTSGFEIEIIPLNDIIVENIDKFGLNTLYQLHKDIALEIIRKSYIYTNEMIDDLFINFPELLTDEEKKRLIFGFYANEDDFGKRSLSKFSSDIYKEFNPSSP